MSHGGEVGARRRGRWGEGGGRRRGNGGEVGGGWKEVRDHPPFVIRENTS